MSIFRESIFRKTVLPVLGRMVPRMAGLSVICLFASAAEAQLTLPGAMHTAPSPAGGGNKASANPPANPLSGRTKFKPRPVGLKAPSEDTVQGRELTRYGQNGRLAIAFGADKTLQITTLTLEGEQISVPRETCRIAVVADEPIVPRLVGKPAGLARYEADIAACPFHFDVMNGAVLIAREPATCDFTAADCRVDPTGLWGPQGSTISEKEARSWENIRGRSEANMRTNFRALLATAGKDKAAIKSIAGDQAGFSSQREMVCRNYAQEEVHGFCALRLTEARALLLQTQYDDRVEKDPELKKQIQKEDAERRRNAELKAAAKANEAKTMQPAAASPGAFPNF
ncbi:hypothetical protein [Beijerinckia indica]|uniref:DUF1311 domain-containing protein n=1 Tax=Beijerinckia indica subsp. indica (strain ATCC 9039 / DSM 1715 / NCIMB 8712) TaxID=395963 RepID=B2IBR3_BEII9|nr:hypothetical protein [Beijerinckia indica]ACB93785.1 hypothetical protein Bind_0127 [Beijerinckia indica subsp. indica ATCC 9039]